MANPGFVIAIQPDRQYLMSGRWQSFSERWAGQLQQLGHEVRPVNVLEFGLREQLQGSDGFLWWFAHLPFPRNAGKRVIAAVEHALRIPTFPDWATIWHFDDKIGQHYLLDAAGIPTARTWVYWMRDDALEACACAAYPLVIKLSSGITSENVRMLRNAADAQHWIERLFGPGVVALEDVRATRVHTAYRRLRGAGRMLLKGAAVGLSSRTDIQHDYLLVQEFLPGNAFDTRITVIGNRAFGFRRFNRPGDFRASGSGRIDWTPSGIAPDAVRLAFSAARSLRTQSLAVDVLRRDGKPVLVEISYYYEAWAVQACPGHWVLQGDPEAGELRWVEGELPPEDAILEDFLEHLRAVR